ncbi:hypothetical protein [Aquifex sp.]
MQVIKGVNFLSYLFASFVAGYVMFGVDMMLDGFLGLFGTYEFYVNLLKELGLFKGYEDIAMVLGHQLNSMVLALFFVHPAVYFRLPGNPFLKGLSFGILWHLLVLVVLFITAFGGAEFMKRFLGMPFSDHLSLFILHVVWGVCLGVLYEPPGDYNP